MNVLVPSDFAERDAKSHNLLLFAGLLAAAAMAWLLVSIFRAPAGLPIALVAAIQVLLIAAANALGVNAACGALHRNSHGLSWRLAGTATWFAPLALYLNTGSPFAIPIAVIVATLAVPHFRKSSAPVETATLVPGRFDLDHVFRPLPRESMSRLLVLAGAAASMEVGIAGGAAGETALGVAFVAVGAVLVSWRLAEQRETTIVKNEARQLVSSGLTLILALVITARGLGSGIGDGEDGDNHRVTAVNGGGGAYWGVYLWPDVSTQPKPLVSPTPATGGLSYKGLKLPLRIRFDGVYWFFRFPAVRPPPEAIDMDGNPAELRFRSTDETPLIMEAHQKLGGDVELECCDRIEVVMRDADTHPGTVALEVILRESALWTSSLSLGRIAIAAIQPFGHLRKRLGQRTVSFPVPHHPSMPAFNEVTIRFHLDSSRWTFSPKMAIEELVMIPR
jgi:hypothetical protein